MDKKICTSCYGSGFSYSISRDWEVEEWETCDRCFFGKAIATYPWKVQEELFNNHLASLPEPEYENEDDIGDFRPTEEEVLVGK